MIPCWVVKMGSLLCYIEFKIHEISDICRHAWTHVYSMTVRKRCFDTLWQIKLTMMSPVSTSLARTEHVIAIVTHCTTHAHCDMRGSIHTHSHQVTLTISSPFCKKSPVSLFSHSVTTLRKPGEKLLSAQDLSWQDSFLVWKQTIPCVFQITTTPRQQPGICPIATVMTWNCQVSLQDVKPTACPNVSYTQQLWTPRTPEQRLLMS